MKKIIFNEKLRSFGNWCFQAWLVRGSFYFFIWTPFRPRTNWAKLYKGIPRKYKGKLWKWVIWKFLCFKPLKCYFMTSGCNPEVQTVLLTPILPYSSMTYVRCHICQLCHFWHLWHNWHLWHRPYVMDEYVNMGVKRTVRTSGLQPDAIQYLYQGLDHKNC